jgi:1-acyl-sn-glycerol-3-phosphate acyltransferase
MTGFLDAPSTEGVRHPTRWPLYHGNRPAQWAIRRWYDVQLHGTEHIPATGPVIFSSNHIGVVDGPLLSIFSPRPVHSLTKVEMFSGFMDWFLHFAGQIPVDRAIADISAVKAGLRVLEGGNAFGIYPEGARGGGDLQRFTHGAAYFALVTGVPVVPVIMLGSRLPGHRQSQLPPRGSRIDIVFGEQFQVTPQPWPRTREQVADASKLLQEHMLVTLDHARASTGRDLPGPLPAM